MPAGIINSERWECSGNRHSRGCPFPFPFRFAAKSVPCRRKSVSKGTRWRIWMVRASFVPVSFTAADSSLPKNIRDVTWGLFLHRAFHFARQRSSYLENYVASDGLFTTNSRFQNRWKYIFHFIVISNIWVFPLRQIRLSRVRISVVPNPFLELSILVSSTSFIIERKKIIARNVLKYSPLRLIISRDPEETRFLEFSFSILEEIGGRTWQ